MYVLRSLHYFLLVSSFYELVNPLTLGSSGEWSKGSFYLSAVEYKTE
jgi:hypothetical protein